MAHRQSGWSPEKFHQDSCMPLEAQRAPTYLGGPKHLDRVSDSHLELCGLQPNREAPNGSHRAFWIPFGVLGDTNQAGRLQTASTELSGVSLTSVSRNQAGSLQMVLTKLSATKLKSYGSQPSREALNV